MIKIYNHQTYFNKWLNNFALFRFSNNLKNLSKLITPMAIKSVYNLNRKLYIISDNNEN